MNNDSLDLGNTNVLILGPLTLQNEFLSYVITKEIGSECSLYDGEMNYISDYRNVEGGDGSDHKLILIDADDPSLEKMIKSITTTAAFAHGPIALFNLDENAGVEKKALSQNIRGFFYKDDHFEVFLKGIRSIMHGEIWVSRKTLLKCVFDSFSDKVVAIKEKTALTSREIEILALVSMGSSNEEIADKICVSTNTVKTHIYNIFKKINVQNRLQAALWAAANL